MTNQKKRNLFAELTEGIDEIKAHKKGKLTLRTHVFERKPRPHIDAELIKKTREALHMSQSVFALKIRVSPRTLEKWEQGLVQPNDQAATLILMVRKYPDTLERLEKI